MNVNLLVLRWLGLLLTAMPMCTSIAQEAEQGTYAGLNEAQAKSKFERTTVELRIKQRESLEATQAELQKLVARNEMDAVERKALQKIIDRIAQSSDFSTVLELALQERRNLSGKLQQPFDAISGKLSDQALAYQQCKLQYQRVAGVGLAKRWTQLSLEQKRIELADYFGLADQYPAWLLRSSPIDIFQLVPKSALPSINQYLGEKADLIQSAQAELQPTIDAVRRLSVQLAKDESLSMTRRSAAAKIAEVIEAPYGRGLRGIWLCLPKPELPDNLRREVLALLQATHQKLEQLRPAHDRLLRDLQTRLESSQSARLKELNFSEQMAVDLYLAKISHLLEPLRVFANRSQRTGCFEDARLLDINPRNSPPLFRVEFLVDGVTHWVECDQLATHAPINSNTHRRVHPPITGPGLTVDDQTDLGAGQVYAYDAAGWRPVNVLDESAAGVVISWHGPAEPLEFFFPRNELRIVSGQ